MVKTALRPWYIRQPGLTRRLYAANFLILLKRLNRNRLKNQRSSLSDGYLKKSLKDPYYILRIGNSSPPPLTPPTRGGEYSLFPCVPPPAPLSEGDRGRF